MSYFERFSRDRTREQWLFDYMHLGFGMRTPTVVLKNVTDDWRTPQEILDELRLEHPHEAALLEEHLVFPQTTPFVDEQGRGS